MIPLGPAKLKNSHDIGKFPHDLHLKSKSWLVGKVFYENAQVLQKGERKITVNVHLRFAMEEKNSQKATKSIGPAMHFLNVQQR